MTLFRRVVSALEVEGIPCAVIGAAAMAVHGVSRSTADLDLLTTDRRALEPGMWERAGLLSPQGRGDAGQVKVEIRRGDHSDPLAGVARFTAPGKQEVDLVVGKYRWQGEAIERASPAWVSGEDLPVVSLVDLVLLKLYAAGPQDAWDVEQLLALVEEQSLLDEVADRVKDLPRESQAMWLRIRDSSSWGR